MLKNILMQYSKALSRIKILRQNVMRLEDRIAKMNERGYYTTDVVTCGRKRKKPLGTVTIAGFPHKEYKEIKSILEKRRENLLREEQNILKLVTQVEECISQINNLEMRNLLTLYYIEDLNWVQVASRMNALDKKNKYTESSCRQKHDRYLEKN